MWLLLFLFFAQILAGGVPSNYQLAYPGNFGAIIHYEMATWAGTQGCSRDNWLQSNDPKIFGVGLNGVTDTDSWGQAMQSAGITYAVYVAKHNCGFTMWPTRTTLPDGSPYNYSIQYSSCPTCNVVLDFLNTCKKYNIKPGFYYSIATNTYLNVQNNQVQNSTLLAGQVLVTQQQFYDIALAQLEELWSMVPGGYFEVWFDGGLPSDDYFQNGIINLKQKYQPQAASFNGFPSLSDTAVRWIGTEDGTAPDPNWSTGSCDQGNANHPPEPDGGDPNSSDWCQAEVDSTLQTGDTWFYVEGLAVHSLSDLVHSYETSLGHNANWILDIAPPKNVTLVPSHMQQYQALGSWVKTCYGSPIATTSLTSGTSITLTLGASPVSVNRVRLTEDFSKGQLVHNYTVSALLNGKLVVVESGQSIGAGKIGLFGASYNTTQLVLTTDAVPTKVVFEAFFCSEPTEK